MRLLHVYDHDYLCHDDAIFSSGAFSRDVWSRYLDAFDRLTVVANRRESTPLDLDGLNRVDRERVDFRFLPKVRTLRRMLSGLLGRNAELAALVWEADAVAVRLTSELGYQAAAFAKRYGKPLAVEAVDCPWDAYTSHSVLGKLIAPLAWWRMRRALASADFALYVTEHFLQGRYPSSGVTANASNVTLIDTEPAGAREWSNERELRIGLVGNCDVRLKGHRVLLDAFAPLAAHSPRTQLVFIGGGDRAALSEEIQRRRLGEQVVFEGRVTAGSPMMAMLDTIDVYVHPSFKEGLPRAVIEAMSRGCPVLASRAGGTAELLPKSCLHKPGDARALGSQLERLLADPEVRRRLGAENVATARRYQPEVLEERRRDFWQRFARYSADSRGE